MTHTNTTPHDASVYDKAIRQTIPFYEEIQTQTIDVVRSIRPDPGCWLDTGCGTGYLAEMALPLFPKTKFILVDPAEDMLAQAHQRLGNYPAGRLHFLAAAPSQGLGAYQEQVRPQVITAVMCHHYLQPDERWAAVEACYRLLEPGGLFVTFENIDPGTDLGRQVGLARWKQFQLEQGRPPDEVEEHVRRFKTKYFPITINQHLDLLRRAGFGEVELCWHSVMQAGFYAIK